jgi:LemA protein
MAKENKPFYLKPWVWILAIVIVLILWLWGSYNNFIVLSQNIDNQWAKVEVQYQRRIDLIPNLVNTAKGYMQFEKSLLEDITSLRSRWMSATTVEDKVNYGNALDSALGRLLVVYENYPDLKSDKVITPLMDELAGTENRIAVERSRYNDMVRDYNTAIMVFPSNILANAFGFKQRTYFQAAPGAENVPQVNLTVP